MRPKDLYQKAKRDKGQCIEYRCTSLGHPKKGGRCHRHHHIFFKESKPAAYAYQNLKSNAKRRGVPFNISLEEFRAFCKATGYLNKAGRKRRNWTIDRIDREDPRGYHLENIQVLTNAQNHRKYWAYEARGLAFESTPAADFDPQALNFDQQEINESCGFEQQSLIEEESPFEL